MHVKIYTLDYCPYCKKALLFLYEKGVEFEHIRVDEDEEKWYEKLSAKFGIDVGDLTLPQIVVDGVRIGGYTDMMELYGQGKFLAGK